VSKEQTEGTSRRNLIVIAAGVVAALVAGVIYYRSTLPPTPTAARATGDPVLSDLLQKGPLEEMELGEANAPHVIVEYASMTCSHCATFHKTTFPALKEKYIDTGKVRYILREFPFDNLAAAAFMLARCAGPDKQFAMIDALFKTQESWAFAREGDPTEHLLQIARQAGFSKERFDECLGDQKLLENILEVRKRAYEVFGVNSTPTFFINGKRLKGTHALEDFEAVLIEEPKSAS
jgi:protein-disulfide isomerase